MSSGRQNVIKNRCENWHRKEKVSEEVRVPDTIPGWGQEGSKARVKLHPGDRRFGRKEENKKGKGG